MLGLLLLDRAMQPPTRKRPGPALRIRHRQFSARRRLLTDPMQSDARFPHNTVKTVIEQRLHPRRLYAIAQQQMPVLHARHGAGQHRQTVRRRVETTQVQPGAFQQLAKAQQVLPRRPGDLHLPGLVPRTVRDVHLAAVAQHQCLRRTLHRRDNLVRRQRR
ncbi:hypothetical protein D3C81_1558370 [compost metagenome]